MNSVDGGIFQIDSIVRFYLVINLYLTFFFGFSFLLICFFLHWSVVKIEDVYGSYVASTYSVEKTNYCEENQLFDFCLSTRKSKIQIGTLMGIFSKINTTLLLINIIWMTSR